VGSLDELNERLRQACLSDRGRRLDGRAASVGEMALEERRQLGPLAGAFGLEEGSDHWVDNKSRVTVRTNRYSVPAHLAGRRVQARLSAQHVRLYYEGQWVAEHARCYGRYQERLQLDHYLEVLWRKPGALAGSVPLAQVRAEGAWPESFDRMWQGLQRRHGESDGTRQMVQLLMVAREKGPEALRQGIEDALAWECFEAGAVELMIRRREDGRPAPAALDVGPLAIYDRPSPGLGRYDQLLADGEEVVVQ
jgi:hypothetical protein